MVSKNLRVILWSIQAVVAIGAAGACAPSGATVSTSPAIASRPTTNALADSLMSWPVHSRTRPLPPIVTPRGIISSPAPRDAVVLFDGAGLSQWISAGKPGAPAPWKVENGYVEVVAHSGNIQTRAAFGDIQLHVEWATPNPPSGEDQERGNSGVYLMKTYEVQVLDSYRNVTYADGQAGSLFGQYPPLVNASLPPGQWQSYDIVFHRPRFNADSSLATPARVTVFHNGILVQDDVPLTGPTSGNRGPYRYHADRMPLELQDHDFPVRYRNIWVRDLERARK
jgi:hypothetical protein